MIRLAVVLGLLLWSAQATAETVRVAVASNFLATLKTLADRFEAAHGTAVVVSSGATGALYAKIRHGAPYDVFLAADARRPALLERDGLAVADSRFTYARGRLVLWSRRPGLLEDGAAALSDGRIARLALANPKTAPYGVAAVETLAHLGLWPAVADKVVRGENVGQTLQFAITGNVDAAFLALAQIRHPAHRGEGSAWIVPAAYHRPLDQQAVLLSSAADRDGARAFLDYLRGPEARALIREHGYDLP